MPEPGIRVLLRGASSDSPVDGKRDVGNAPPDNAPQDVAATADSELEQIVAEERLAQQGADLLTHEAPEE